MALFSKDVIRGELFCVLVTGGWNIIVCLEIFIQERDLLAFYPIYLKEYFHHPGMQLLGMCSAFLVTSLAMFMNTLICRKSLVTANALVMFA